MKLNITLSLDKVNIKQPHNEIVCYAEILPGFYGHDGQEFHMGIVEETKILSEVYSAIQDSIERYNAQRFREKE